MNKQQLKKVLRPLIKECIREIIFEEKGVLSHIITEVVNGVGTQEKVIVRASKMPKFDEHVKAKPSQRMNANRKKLLDAIGKDAYNGVNIFEGVTPTPGPAAQGQAQGALSGVSPSDPGVDISNMFSGKSAAIFNKMMENK